MCIAAITLTYTEETNPRTPPEALRNLDHFTDRMIQACKQQKRPRYKYIAITEDIPGKEVDGGPMYHHTLFSNEDFTQEMAEKCWRAGLAKKAEPLGEVMVRLFSAEKSEPQLVLGYCRRPDILDIRFSRPPLFPKEKEMAYAEFRDDR